MIYFDYYQPISSLLFFAPCDLCHLSPEVTQIVMTKACATWRATCLVPHDSSIHHSCTNICLLNVPNHNWLLYLVPEILSCKVGSPPSIFSIFSNISVKCLSCFHTLIIIEYPSHMAYLTLHIPLLWEYYIIGYAPFQI